MLIRKGKWGKLIISMMILLMLTNTAFASQVEGTKIAGNAPIYIEVEDKSILTGKDSVFLLDAYTEMCPLRLIVENLGGTISWDNIQKAAILEYNNNRVSIFPGTKKLLVNDAVIEADYPILLKDSRIFASFAFYKEILSAKTSRDLANRILKFNNPSSSMEDGNISEDNIKTRERLATFLSELEFLNDFSGQVFIVKDNQVIIDRAYGYADYENKIKAETKTTFSVGSITKQMTAASIMKLYQENKIGLEDKVSKYLSNVPHGNEISIHQLLNHTSGLYDYSNLALELMMNGGGFVSFDYIMSRIKDKPLEFTPGTQEKYSNTGYLVLGEIVEKVSEMPLEIYLMKNIFSPANMVLTKPSYDASGKNVVAKGYKGTEPKVDYLDAIYVKNAYGAGFLCSTAQEIYLWNTAFLNGKIISQENALLQMTNKYGWIRLSEGYGTEISHSGNTMGFTSYNGLFPDTGTQIIIITNRGMADLYSMKLKLLKVIFQK